MSLKNCKLQIARKSTGKEYNCTSKVFFLWNPKKDLLWCSILENDDSTPQITIWTQVLLLFIFGILEEPSHLFWSRKTAFVFPPSHDNWKVKMALLGVVLNDRTRFGLSRYVLVPYEIGQMHQSERGYAKRQWYFSAINDKLYSDCTFNLYDLGTVILYGVYVEVCVISDHMSFQLRNSRCVCECLDEEAIFISQKLFGWGKIYYS
jgi:hypothetical protein